jgi:hypothetical protein
MVDAHPTVIDVPDQSGVQLNRPTIADESDLVSWRFRLRLNLPLLIGAAVVLLSIGLALTAPWLTSHDPLEIADASLSPPSSQYLLGTDQLGRDVLTRILYAARSSLAAACLSAALAFASGTMIGLLAGYSSGLIDACLMRVLDILQAFPALLLAIALVAALGPNLPNLVLTMGCCSCRVSPASRAPRRCRWESGLHCRHRARRPRADPVPARSAEHRSTPDRRGVVDGDDRDPDRGLVVVSRARRTAARSDLGRHDCGIHFRDGARAVARP